MIKMILNYLEAFNLEIGLLINLGKNKIKFTNNKFKYMFSQNASLFCHAEERSISTDYSTACPAIGGIRMVNLCSGYTIT